MSQEEKDLLVKDLCSRLPYGVKCRQFKLDSQICTLTADLLGKVGNLEPYLRPMSSMTEEERMKFSKLLNVRYCEEDWKGHHSTSYCIEIYNGYPDEAGRIKYPSTFSMNVIDWLNSHHFDYRGLIEKGLALEAPEGMYDSKNNTKI